MENQLLPNGDDPTRRKNDGLDAGESEHEEGDEEEETKKLEEEVKEMADKLNQYRSKLPTHLISTLSSFLASQRPLLSLSSDQSGSLPGPSGGAGFSCCSSSGVLTTDDENFADDVKLLRDKVSNNISAMPIVLKKMNECISRIDNLVSSNETIHPAFRWKKI